MRLSNPEAAIIAPEKCRDYLLSPIHPVGRYKAACFRSRGYEQQVWETLANDISVLALEDATIVETTEFGAKYAISGAISAPAGGTFNLCSLWIILTNENILRLATAYPEE